MALGRPNPPPITDLIPVERPRTGLPDAVARQERESIRLLLNYGDRKLDEENSLHQYFFSELEEVEFKTGCLPTDPGLNKV